MKTLLVLLCFVVGFGVSLVHSTDVIMPSVKTSSSIVRLQRQLQREYERYDSDEMVQMFRDTYGMMDPGSRHDLEHALGSELYRREGFAGLSVCQDSSYYGCFHGLFSAAVGEVGIDSIEQLFNMCTKQGDIGNQSNCFHGVGHGILAHFGYTYDHLVSSLYICDRMDDEGMRTACYSGVFMEHFIPNMKDVTDENTIDSIASTADTCVRIEQRYKESCYFELPGLWIHENSRQEFKSFGDKCMQIQLDAYRISCYRGLAQVLSGAYGFDAHTLADICVQMPDEGVSYCLGMVARQLVASQQLEDLTDMCEYVRDMSLDCPAWMESYEKKY